MENVKKEPVKGKKINVRTITGIGLLTAIVVVLQFISMYLLRFSAFSITLTLLPIVVGAALYGWKSGAWLGLVFGAAVLLTGDANGFMTLNVPGTIITVLAKGALAGAGCALIYSLIAKKNRTVAVVAASVAAPVINTGVFILGCLVFFLDPIKAWAAGGNALVYILVALVGGNFFIELGINLVLNPVIVRLLDLGKKMAKTH